MKPLTRLGPALVVTVLLCSGCRPSEAPGAASGRQASDPVASEASDGGAGLAHADHRPRHGGLVLMNGDLHFEVVLDPAGRYEVFFSDAVRRELPASTASDVVITVLRRTGAPERVPLRIDDGDRRWVGSGARVSDPDAIARVSHVASGKPYFIDLPLARPVTSDR